MRSTAAAALALPFLAVALSCGDRSDTDLGGREVGPDLFSVVSTDGAVRMALTNEYVYLALTDEIRDDALDDIRSSAEADGSPGRFLGFVERMVGKALQFRVLYPVDDIEDIQWRDGSMHIEFVSDRRRDEVRIRVDDRPVNEAFDEESVREFREAFHALKRVAAERDG